MNKEIQIPKEVSGIINALNEAGFEAYIVGGCVRDILIGRDPKDWDITTSAQPEDILKIFPDSFYENKFGTVGVITGSEIGNLKVIEVTTYRIDGEYSDARHPDQVQFAKTLEEDLARRDFTVNALALDFTEGGALKIIDLFGGQEDLENKIIRAVGEPEKRFKEDALRMMRAVRFLAQFSKGDSATKKWEIEEKTQNAIIANKNLMQKISKERIRDEFLKLIDSDNPYLGIETLRQLGLLKYVLPELEDAYGVSQNKHHIYDVYEHSMRALAFAAQKKYGQDVRLAALFHDIGKPDTKHGQGSNCTFYNHEVVGAKIAKKILERLKFSNKQIEKVVTLVRYHLFYYNVDEVTESSVRRLVRKVGAENMEELIQVRACDRIGSGVPKAEPYKLRHLKYIIEKVSRDPIMPKMLVAKGEDVMRILDISPGPKIGRVLNILLDEVLDDPARNKKEYLEQRIVEIGKMSDDELKKLNEKAEKKKEDIQTKIETVSKKKYWVS